MNSNRRIIQISFRLNIHIKVKHDSFSIIRLINLIILLINKTMLQSLRYSLHFQLIFNLLWEGGGDFMDTLYKIGMKSLKAVFCFLSILQTL